MRSLASTSRLVSGVGARTGPTTSLHATSLLCGRAGTASHPHGEYDTDWDVRLDIMYWFKKVARAAEVNGWRVNYHNRNNVSSVKLPEHVRVVSSQPSASVEYLDVGHRYRRCIRPSWEPFFKGESKC